LSDRVSADEALRWAREWVCEPEELADKTREIALRLARGPTVAYRYIKENLNRAMAGDVDDCLDLEATHHVHCGQTQDHREGDQGVRGETRAGVSSGAKGGAAGRPGSTAPGATRRRGAQDSFASTVVRHCLPAVSPSHRSSIEPMTDWTD